MIQSKNPQLFVEFKIDESAMPVFILVQKTDSGELKYFNFDQIVRNLQTTKEANKGECMQSNCNRKKINFYLIS